MTSKRALGATPLWLVALVGVTVTTLGILIQAGTSERISTMFAGTVSALGGGIIARFTSDDAELGLLRRRWHVYHQTRFDGAVVWRYTCYPFDRDLAAGSVTAVVTEPEFGLAPLYRVEAGVRGTRMVYLETAQESNEPPTVGVLPVFSGPRGGERGSTTRSPSVEPTRIARKLFASLQATTPRVFVKAYNLMTLIY